MRNKKILFEIALLIFIITAACLSYGKINKIIKYDILNFIKQENIAKFQYDYYRQLPNGKYATLINFNDPNGIDKISYVNENNEEVTLYCDGKTEVSMDFQAYNYTHYYFTSISSVGEKNINDLYLEAVPTEEYLYNYGNEYTDLTGGWLMSAQAYSGGEKGSNYLKIWFTSTMYNVATFTTANKIDISKYTKLHVVANYTGSHCAEYTGRFEATDSNNKTLTTYFTYSNGQNQDYSLDLSSMTGLVNIKIWGCAEIYIYEVYLSNT